MLLSILIIVIKTMMIMMMVMMMMMMIMMMMKKIMMMMMTNSLRLINLQKGHPPFLDRQSQNYTENSRQCSHKIRYNELINNETEDY